LFGNKKTGKTAKLNHMNLMQRKNPLKSEADSMWTASSLPAEALRCTASQQQAHRMARYTELHDLLYSVPTVHFQIKFILKSIFKTAEQNTNKKTKTYKQRRIKSK